MSVIGTSRSAAGPTRSGVLVLLYHRLVEDHLYAGIPLPENIFSIPESRFREQIDHLAAAGYHGVSLPRFQRILEGCEQLPERAVLITFDDGCESVFRLAAPHLARRGMPAVVFVTANPASSVFTAPHSQRRLSGEEMRALERQGILCESHGLSHAGLGDLTDSALRDELVLSKRHLEEVIGREVTALALPLNSLGRRVFLAAREAGYRMVFTSNPGLVRAGDDPLTLRRVLVDGSSDLDGFLRGLSHRGLRQRRLLAWAKRLPPRLMGYRRWMPLRQRLFASSLGPALTPTSLRRALTALGWLVSLGATGCILVALARLIFSR